MPEREAQYHPASLTEQRKPFELIALVPVGAGSLKVLRNDAFVFVEALNEKGEIIGASMIPRGLFDEGLSGVQAQEAELVPEFPLLRIEGNLGRAPDFRTGKHPEHRGQPELYMRLAYHPNPDNREETVWYDVFLWGDAARAGRALELRAGQPVQMVGKHKGYTRMVKPRSGGDPVEREFHELYVADATDIVKLRRLPKTIAETPQPNAP